MDIDNDGIPNINIDNKGDFKPYINISKNEKTPHVNIALIHSWKPKKNDQINTFLYDSMEIEPLLHIDTNHDDCPDINLDLDHDGAPELNIDVTGDNISDTNIDSTGDGKADANINTDGDGIPDENIVEIAEWKADIKIGKICTMIIKQRTNQPIRMIPRMKYRETTIPETTPAVY